MDLKTNVMDNLVNKLKVTMIDGGNQLHFQSTIQSNIHTTTFQSTTIQTSTNNKNTICNNASLVDDKLKGDWYLDKLDHTCKDIKEKIKKTEKYLEDDNKLMNEDIKGILRSSIGKANLLIDQKLKQFRELCHKNLNGKNNAEEFETKNEDLDGFWEIVSMQVDDVNNMFHTIDELKANEWKIVEKENNIHPKVKPTKKCSLPKLSNNVKKPSDKTTAREEARKTRLKEAKARLASKVQNNNNNNLDDITIFIPSSVQTATNVKETKSGTNSNNEMKLNNCSNNNNELKSNNGIITDSGTRTQEK